jgi:hypothetical protein
VDVTDSVEFGEWLLNPVANESTGLRHTSPPSSSSFAKKPFFEGFHRCSQVHNTTVTLSNYSICGAILTITPQIHYFDPVPDVPSQCKM